MFAGLVGLGVWQLERRIWKAGVLARIAAAESAPATPLGAGADPGASEFAKHAATGWFRPGCARFGAEVRDGPGGAPMLGQERICVLDRQDGVPVLIDRGWLEDATADPPVLSMPETVTGYVRRSSIPSLFAAHDDLAARRFYTFDVGKIAASLGAPDALPFALVALTTALPAPGTPRAAIALPRPPNDHLSYAVTWFSLAMVLAIIAVLRFSKRFR